MKVSVIISTYNHPEWLEKVLWGYECQTYKDFEVVIADDGSGEPTQNLIERIKKESSLDIHHVWHEDKGYQKCQILNKAILAAHTQYLIFTDGDCIPRKDFVFQHVSYAEKGYYLSGGVVRLPLNTSKIIARDDIISGNAFNLGWLLDRGLPQRVLKNLKLTAQGMGASILNKITPRKATWNGGNSSGWKDDLLSVNGFDERMEYGGQDVECGYRLINNGIKSKQLVYSLAAVHLDHGRGYRTEEAIKKSLAIRKATLSSKMRWTPYGIVKSEKPVAIRS